jgi:hypothetical protein
MQPMIVLTTKRDGGTQDVQGFYHLHEIRKVAEAVRDFLQASTNTPRAIARVELYNPPAEDESHLHSWENEGGSTGEIPPMREWAHQRGKHR